jgi:hypothetical protein
MVSAFKWLKDEGIERRRLDLRLRAFKFTQSPSSFGIALNWLDPALSSVRHERRPIVGGSVSI